MDKQFKQLQESLKAIGFDSVEDFLNTTQKMTTANTNEIKLIVRVAKLVQKR